MNAKSDAREIAALVSMSRLLAELGFVANERTHRAPCLLHFGSNPTAFSWRDDGCWHCFSCGAGGDRIALLRAVKQCSFREAVAYLAVLAGVEFRPSRVSRQEIARRKVECERAKLAAWRIFDEIGRLRRYYTDVLHRTERLQMRIGSESLRASSESACEAVWDRLARLAPVCTFFFSAWNYIWDTKPKGLVRFALASPTERRRFILQGDAA